MAPLRSFANNFAASRLNQPVSIAQAGFDTRSAAKRLGYDHEKGRSYFDGRPFFLRFELD